MKLLATATYVNAQARELAAEFSQIEFIVPETAEERLAAAADAEIMVGPVGEELFLAAPKLRWIQSGSAGVEWMRNAPSLIESDVTVTNMKGAHASTIAEHTFGMLVFLARKFGTIYEAQLEKQWLGYPNSPTGVGLAGLTMGVIGMGQIGRAVAKRAHAFEMNILAVDAHPVEKPEYVAELRLLDGLSDLMRRSDVVVVAVPITPETRGMLSPDQLKLLQPTSYLLVMSRGGIVDEPTVARMLREGQLAGAGFDVTAIEPLPPDSELWTAPNIIISPHNSPSSAQTGANTKAILRENLTRYLAGEPLLNVVDKRLGY